MVGKIGGGGGREEVKHSTSNNRILGYREMESETKN